MADTMETEMENQDMSWQEENLMEFRIENDFKNLDEILWE